MSDEHIPLSNLSRHIEFEAEVAALAWRYYEEEGLPEGRAQEHWLRAEAEVRRRHEVAKSLDQGQEPPHGA